MAFITPAYTWATGNTITAVRLNSNITNITDALSQGTKDVNVLTLQIGGTVVIDNSQNFITTGKYNLNLDGTAINTAGAFTYGAGQDAAIYWDGAANVLQQTTALTNTVSYNKLSHITSGTPATGIGTGIQFETETSAGNNEIGIVLDAVTTDVTAGSEDFDFVIKCMASGAAPTEIARFQSDGKLDLVSGAEYQINGTDVLSSTTLGTGVVNSSLTSVGALDSGTITSNFGAIDNGTSNITTGGILKVDVDGTGINAAGSVTLGAGNDAGIYWDGTKLLLDASGTSFNNYTVSGITASTTQTQGQGALTGIFNEVSTVANNNDTVTLPSATAGLEVTVINNGANNLQIFPATGDNLGKGVNTSRTIVKTGRIVFRAYNSTNWYMVSYVSDWQTWSPTYTAGGSMTWTSIVTEHARYKVNNDICTIEIYVHGVTGGTASTNLIFTLPINPANTGTHFSGQAYDGYAGAYRQCSGIDVGSNQVYVNQDENVNWALNTFTGFGINGVYEIS